MDFQPYYKLSNQYQNTSNFNETSTISKDTETKTDNSDDPEVLIKEEICAFQRIVYNAEIRKTILTGRILRDLLTFKKIGQHLDSDNESDSDSDTESATESEQLNPLDNVIDDTQLQVLRTILKAAKKNVLKLTRNMFLCIIDNLKFE
jgi:hypothetical protein